MITDRLSAEIDTQPAGLLRELLKDCLSDKIASDIKLVEAANSLENVLSLCDKLKKKEAELLEIIIKKNFIIKDLGGEV